MATLNAELSNFTARDVSDLEQSAPKSADAAALPLDSKLSVSDEPGDFYWHEDAPAVPLWKGAIIALRHMLGMKI
jgi:hypothetical protein